MIEKFKNETIDPSQSSFVERSLDLVRIGYEFRTSIGDMNHPRPTEIYIDRNTGEKFHKIIKEPQLQRLVSLLSKGIINTSDILEYKGEYYSHEQDAKSIKEKIEKLPEEITADLFILNNVFADSDHGYYPEHHTKRIHSESGQGVIEDNDFLQHSNVLVDEKNKKVNYFDFNLVFGYKSSIESSIIKEVFNDLLSEAGPGFSERNKGTLHEYPSNNRIEVLKILKSKTEKFINEVFNDEKFKTFETIFEKSKVKENSSEGLFVTKQGIFEHLTERFKILYEVVNEELKK